VSGAELTDAEILSDIKNRPVVKVWPHYAWAVGVSRNKAYQIANEALEKGNGEFLDLSSIRAVTAPLRKRLGIK
jgi:hypothetical protein